MPRILVVNPNSTEACTTAIDRAMAPFRLGGGPQISCFTLEEGPSGIESQADSDGVVAPLVALARRRTGQFDALVIACFSDPGVPTLREVAGCPVFGIGEAGMLTATTLGDRFGVVAILPASTRRQRRMARQLGLVDRYAGSRAIDMPVTELSDASKTQDRMIEAGRELRDRDAADVLVMGCAGMADYRRPLTEALGIPVVEPTQAAVTMALGTVLRGW